MARKIKYPEYGIAGRPPKDPNEKIGTPVRALVTMRVAEMLAAISLDAGISAPERGLVSSDVVRLALYALMRDRKMLTPEIEKDPTWDGLKEKGLV